MNGAGSYGLNKSREEKRRLSHTAAEQKRRNAIKVTLEYFLLFLKFFDCLFVFFSSSKKYSKKLFLWNFLVCFENNWIGGISNYFSFQNYIYK